MKRIILSLASLLFVTLLSAQVADCFDECFYEPESACFFLYDPVCGCDGVEYSNSCFALVAGIPGWTVGVCSGECTNSVSFSATYEGSIETSDIPPSFRTDEYCFSVNSSESLSESATYFWDFGNGSTSAESEPCTSFITILEGVPQELNYHVVLTVSDGDCIYIYNRLIKEEVEDECMDLVDVDFGECDMALGIGLVDQSCVFISGCSMTGSDGVDYSDYFFENMDDCNTSCVSCPDLTGVDFGVCAMALGIGMVNESCVYISGCSMTGSDGVDYSDSFYESFEECNAACGSCIDQTLIDLDAICPTVAIPVCGCDGVTYNNGCEAENYYGVTSFTNGPCQIEPCTDLADIDFGECEMLMGVGIVDGLCSYISGCGSMVQGTDYSGAIFTSMEECNQCDQSECINPAQINPDGACTLEYDPVCGCNDVTYSNSCFATHAGVTSWTAGECVADNIEDADSPLNRLRVFPNPSSGIVYLELENENLDTVVLLNQLGQQVFSFENQKNSSSSLDVSTLTRGIYYLKIQSETGKIYTSKIEVTD